MENLKESYKLSTVITIISSFLIILSSPGCSISGWKMEDDKENSNFIGKIVTFKEPISYVLIPDPENNIDYHLNGVKSEGRSIDKVLTTTDIASDRYKHEAIHAGMKFTIMGSYWIKFSGLSAEFNSDLRNFILKDENGVISIGEILLLELSSDFKR